MSQQINLFNPIFLKQKKHFSARTMVHGLALIVSGLAAVYALQVYQLSSMRTQELGMRLQAQRTSQQLVAATGAPGAKDVFQVEIRRAEAELKSLQGVAASIENESGGGGAGGFSRYFAAFARQPVSGLWLTGFTVTGDDIEVRGRAVRAELLPVFIRRLSREEVLRGKGFAEVNVMARSETPKPENAPSGSSGEAPQRYVEFSLGTREKRGSP